MKFHDVVETSRRISATGLRLEKISILSEFLRSLAPDEVPVAVDYLCGKLRQGKIGIGYAIAVKADRTVPDCTNPQSWISRASRPE